MNRVVIAVPTFRRPQWLARLLRTLEAIETPAQIRVIVADNDAEKHQGVDVCASLAASGYRWPLEAFVVAERGISQVRNGLIARALADGPQPFFLTMIDDDEWPGADWLENLLAVQRSTGADIVQGPVLCEYARKPAAWAEISNSTPAPREGSGPIARADAGGNVLMSSACLARAAGAWFDPQFGLTGGEDKDFFVRMAQLGATFAWSAEAVAYTSIPESRMSLGWALGRAFRAGNCDLRITRKYDRSMRTLARESAKLAGALALSPLQFVAGIGSPTQRARAAVTFARALGKAAAPLGGEYREYRRTHGG